MKKLDLVRAGVVAALLSGAVIGTAKADPTPAQKKGTVAGAAGGVIAGAVVGGPVGAVVGGVVGATAGHETTKPGGPLAPKHHHHWRHHHRHHHHHHAAEKAAEVK